MEELVTKLYDFTCILFNTKQETDIRKMKNGVVARSKKPPPQLIKIEE